MELKFRIPSRIKSNFRENLEAPFIIGFQVLLLVCMGSLIQGNPGLANELAIYAYYLLVAWVVLQLASFLRHGKAAELEE